MTAADTTTARIGPLAFSKGWLAMVALFLNALVIQGMAIGGITMFDDRVIAALDTTRGALKFRDLIYIFATALSCLAIGWIVERIGVRVTAVLGLVLMSIILAAYGLVDSLLAIYVLHAALGFSFASTHVVVLMIVFSRWFPLGDARRGIALGIAIAGASLGAVVLSRVIALGLGAADWREVISGLALLPLILIVPTWLMVRPPHPVAADPWTMAIGREARC
jgi:sugar phosphate permease